MTAAADETSRDAMSILANSEIPDKLHNLRRKGLQGLFCAVRARKGLKPFFTLRLTE
jgi:hypothetical protein